MPTIPIVMPQLGESIAEATVVSLHTSVGMEVAADEEIMEVETNKAVMAVTAPCAGFIQKLVVEVGSSYPVGTTLALFEVAAQDAPNPLGTPSSDTPSRALPESNGAAPSADKPHFATSEEDALAPVDAPAVEPTVRGLPVPANATGATYISPRMRARMDELGFNASDLAGIAGSGSGGRLTVEDFERYLSGLEKEQMTPASPMRIAVADSMRRSWARPLATVGSPVVLDPVLAHRRTALPKPGPALYALRALAIALAENPEIGGRLVGDQIVKPRSIDIGFAVEVDDGVMVPVIAQADQQTLSELVTVYDELVAAARARRLPPEATRAGIATVTNFGVFGIVWATPIPLPEQNLVLGLGVGRKKPFWSPQVEQFIPVIEAEITLSFDHRILDGGAAGRLLGRIAELLQTPEAL